MDSSSSSHGIGQLQQRCYYEWMTLQSKHIVNLKEAFMNLRSNDDDHHKLKELVGVIVDDFQKYAKKRSKLFNQSCSSYFAPSWNSSLENSFLWMGGCRPSSFVRVIYALCGAQVETQFSQYLHKFEGNENVNESDGFMSELTGTQLGKINDLHIKVIRKEDTITKICANMQDYVADMPIVATAYSMDLVEASVDVDNALDKHEEGMGVLMAEADKLRIDTLKKIVEVLTPVQAAEFLLAGKRLQVSLHEWGRVREERRFGCARTDSVAGAGTSKGSATC